MKRALVCGISGQDGAYLSQLLLDKGYEVFGTSRDAQVNPFDRLSTLGIREKVQLESMTLTDFRSVLQVLSRVDPDEIYNLAGQSSVGLSFEMPVETLESISVGTLNLLEAIRFIGRHTRLYNAGSGECFGDTGEGAANELSAFRPRSPYAVAKSTAHWLVTNYRQAYSLDVCSGILFNHESPLRPRRFVTRKIVTAACRIKHGLQQRLQLGRVDIQRDWGWAPEYVQAMWLMLQQDEVDDYVIATGESNSLEDFVQAVFAAVDLDSTTYVDSKKALFRPLDISRGCGNPDKATERLGWQATSKMHDVAKMMVAAELELMASDRMGGG